MQSVVRKKSYGSVTVFWLDRSEALRRLAEAARRLLDERPQVKAVYLFGSLAANRAVPGSDADILVLLEASDRRGVDRPADFYPYFAGVGLPVDLFCYTVAEAVQSPLARQALSRGILLAGRADQTAWSGAGRRPGPEEGGTNHEDSGGNEHQNRRPGPAGRG